MFGMTTYGHGHKGRKVSVLVGYVQLNPIENERYYLTVLLNNVRGPTLFEYLLTVIGHCCKSFQEAAHKRGLLHNDDDIEQTLQEASTFRMPPELRRLFTTLLHYCKPANPSSLFNKFYEFMVEDFVLIKNLMHLSKNDVLQKVLQGINDTLESLGRDINEFKLVSFQYVPNEYEKLTREIGSEKNIPVPDEHLQGIHKLKSQQKIAFDTIYSAAMSDSGRVFFVEEREELERVSYTRFCLLTFVPKDTLLS
ncbi:hypothetical protein LIER_35857 [Lithospermum erythrorhizon]|uniref:Uncharacterized protein n=1 Tax=Lithospermum erythrorhizon TaxID=34254 RepID=A0AAV3NY53_LITER